MLSTTKVGVRPESQSGSMADGLPGAESALHDNGRCRRPKSKPSDKTSVGISNLLGPPRWLLRNAGLYSESAGIAASWVFSNESSIIMFNAFGVEYGPESSPSLFYDRGSGYMAQASLSSVQQIFLKKGSFEVELLEYAKQIGQTATIGELISPYVALDRPAVAYTGPVQVR